MPSSRFPRGPAGAYSMRRMQHSRRTARGGTALGALALLLALTSCAGASQAGSAAGPAAVSDVVPVYADVAVTPDIAYGTRDGAALLLDACAPADLEKSLVNNGPLRAVISVHGGSWREGDKASTWWRSTCEWLASQGFVAFSVNYTLSPTAPFPAAIDDLKAAVEWVRSPAQAEAYGYDPALIAAFGGSAGGNLVSLLGASGDGDLGTGSRVAAVVELSGPIDLTKPIELPAPNSLDPSLTAGFAEIQLQYLGCAAHGCRAATSASPHLQLDPSDPPFFIGHSSAEYIPLEHATVLADALADNDVPVTFVEVPGGAHSIGLLGTSEPTPMRAQIVEFLRSALR